MIDQPSKPATPPDRQPPAQMVEPEPKPDEVLTIHHVIKKDNPEEKPQSS